MGQATPIGQIKKGIHKTKILLPEQVNIINRDQLRQTAKQSEMGQAIVQVYPELSFEDFDHEKFVQIRASFIDFLNSKTTNELYTRLELNNLIKLSKQLMLARVQKNLKEGKLPGDLDLKRLDKVIEHLMNLDKIKHGEKKIIAKMDFSYIQGLT